MKIEMVKQVHLLTVFIGHTINLKLSNKAKKSEGCAAPSHRMVVQTQCYWSKEVPPLHLGHINYSQMVRHLNCKNLLNIEILSFSQRQYSLE